MVRFRLLKEANDLALSGRASASSWAAGLNWSRHIAHIDQMTVCLKLTFSLL